MLLSTNVIAYPCGLMTLDNEYVTGNLIANFIYTDLYANEEGITGQSDLL